MHIALCIAKVSSVVGNVTTAFVGKADRFRQRSRQRPSTQLMDSAQRSHLASSTQLLYFHTAFAHFRQIERGRRVSQWFCMPLHGRMRLSLPPLLRARSCVRQCMQAHLCTCSSARARACACACLL
mmetsp:Transcript_26249/g.57537  ORF Transcript_26249/g.57537 Transcript_26249/m.57537 type:complete len:126 (+) Transcript_26249:365-742(+)